MIIFLLLVIIAVLTSWVYLKWRKVKNYWPDRKVPHLPPNPIFGSLTFLMKENPGKWLKRMHDEFKSPYIGVWLFWRPCLLVNSPEIAKNILVRDFMNFRDRFLSSGKTDPLGGLNLFTMNDPLWTPIRRRLSSIFTARKLRCLQNYIQSKSNELVQRIQNEGNYIKDLKKFYTDYTTDAIGTSAFGVESNATLTGKGPLRDVTRDFSKFSLFRGLSWSSIFFFPELVDFFRFKFYPAPSEAYFKKIYRHIEAQRKADKERNTQDLLDLLLKIKSEGEINGEGYSDDVILAQAAIFLFGGYETTGTLLTFATYTLAHHPDIQEKLYKELIEAKGKNGSDEFEAQTLSQLPYLNAVLKGYSVLKWWHNYVICVSDTLMVIQVTASSSSMILIILAILAGCLGTLVYLKWSRVKSYWAKRNVPYSPPNLIIGSLTFLMRQNPGIWFRTLNDQFRSPYIGIWLFWKPCLVVNSPDIAKNVLIRDFANFRDRYVSSGDTDPLGGLNLFTLNDPIWTPIRRRLSSIFTAAKLRCLEDYICLKCKELIKRIANEGHELKDLKRVYTDFTTDVIGTSAFGVESNATLTGKGPMRDITTEFSTFSVFRGMSWCSIFFLPKLVDFFRFKFYSKPSEAYFRKIFHSIAAQREAATNERTYQDLVELLLKIKKESKLNGEGYTDDFIIAQAAIFLLGGYESVGTMLMFASCELAYHPDKQEKLYQELLEAKERNVSDVFKAQTLSELPYLDSVLKETLRKHTAMGWLDRIAASDYQIDDTLTIEAGTVVYINSIGIHYDPKYFPEPKKFMPERFLPENANDIYPYSYLPFGDGPRFCIGKRFGLMTVRFALTSVILNYKIVPLPNTPRPDDIKIDNRGLFYFPGEPVPVKFIPRNY